MNLYKQEPDKIKLTFSSNNARLLLSTTGLVLEDILIQNTRPNKVPVENIRQVIEI